MVQEAKMVIILLFVLKVAAHLICINIIETLTVLNRREEDTILEFLGVHQNQMSVMTIAQMWNLFLFVAPQRTCIPVQKS